MHYMSAFDQTIQDYIQRFGISEEEAKSYYYDMAKIQDEANDRRDWLEDYQHGDL